MYVSVSGCACVSECVFMRLCVCLRERVRACVCVFVCVPECESECA